MAGDAGAVIRRCAMRTGIALRTPRVHIPLPASRLEAAPTGALCRFRSAQFPPHPIDEAAGLERFQFLQGDVLRELEAAPTGGGAVLGLMQLPLVADVLVCERGLDWIIVPALVERGI